MIKTIEYQAIRITMKENGKMITEKQIKDFTKEDLVKRILKVQQTGVHAERIKYLTKRKERIGFSFQSWIRVLSNDWVLWYQHH
jgi:hypothetical protein